MSLLRGIRIVLVEPEVPGNLGACARLCENFGVEDWFLVRPRCSPQDEEARKLAVDSARTRLESVRTVESLEEAVADCQEVIGFTRRQRGRTSVSFEWRNLPDVSPVDTGRRTALVFGSERTGLESHELALCSRRCELPTDPGLPSLNLSHAVACALIALADARSTPPGTEPGTDPEEAPAPRAEVEHLFGHWRELLVACGLTQAGNPERLLGLFRAMLSRSGIRSNEIRALRAVFARALSRMMPE